MYFLLIYMSMSSQQEFSHNITYFHTKQVIQQKQGILIGCLFVYSSSTMSLSINLAYNFSNNNSSFYNMHTFPQIYSQFCFNMMYFTLDTLILTIFFYTKPADSRQQLKLKYHNFFAIFHLRQDVLQFLQ